MNKLYRKIIPLFSLSLLLTVNSIAQQNHFIYVQTENKHPFYIKLDKKILSSSASGYLIIPKLQDGDYTLSIGFPKNEWPEQNVTCNINKKDAGYLLKDFGSKGWGLFNLQTMDVIMSGVKPTEKTAAIEENKQDIFSNTLSNVVNDPSIAKKTVEKQPVVIKEEIIPIIKEDIKPVAEVLIKEDSPKLITQISKLSANKRIEGTDLVYIDMVNGKGDTVNVFIPEEIKEMPTQQEKKVTASLVEPFKKEDALKEEIKKDGLIKEESQKEPVKNAAPKFIDIELPNPNVKTDTVVKLPVSSVTTENKPDIVQLVPEKPKENNSRPVIANSDCKNFASEDDFLKLRKKMAAEDNDDDMVGVAKKILKSKCFTVDQVKNLSVLFLKDEGKYKFFDAAYPFVSDSYNFSTLQSQLTDEYFISRFKAMIRH
jgi:Domain of unknown function (DUF4476)